MNNITLFNNAIEYNVVRCRYTGQYKCAYMGPGVTLFK